jgi:hypothetical protein
MEDIRCCMAGTNHVARDWLNIHISVSSHILVLLVLLVLILIFTSCRHLDRLEE